MTQEEAGKAVQDILSEIDRLALLPSKGIFQLQGGQLDANPHPEYPSHWRPVWQPSDSTLMPLDLEKYPAKVAAEQIARYRHDAAYIPIRHKLENLFALLKGHEIDPVERHYAPDSFLVGALGMKIVETRVGPHDVGFDLVLQTHPLPEALGQGEPTPDPQQIIVTRESPSEILEQVRNSLNN